MDKAVVGHPYAKAAVDMAIYDIVGKHLNVPVYDLLGGCFKDKIPIANSIGIMEKEMAVKEAKEVVDEGVKTIKIKVFMPGRDPEADVEIVRVVRDAVGDKIDITIDANQGWSTQVAIKTIKKMEKYNLRFVEQPVRGLRNMARVVAEVETPIMADESAWTQYDILEIADKKAADMISLYTTKPGGLFNAKKAASVAETAGLPCNLNGSIETGVGNAANIHLAASTEIVTEACVIPVTTIKGREQAKIANVYYTDDIIKDPFKYEDGCLCVPRKPGLGIELDEEKMLKYGIKSWP
jgi:muconate cycloisomerase